MMPRPMSMLAVFMNSRSLMFRRLRAVFARSPIFSFNLVNRDRWVGEQAEKLQPGSRLLDVGAGSCPYRSLFSHCEYYAQDFTELQEEQLRHGSYGKIDYVCDASAIPVASASFDTVLCTEMLEHVSDPLAVVRELSRLLKPGGKLILTAPLGSGIHQEPHHYYGGFTPYWYKKFLTEVGFSDIQVEPNAGSYKFFSQEALRFIVNSRPFFNLPILQSVLWFPLWLSLVPVLGGIVPVVCHFFDKYDQERRFTVGYHVTAIRT